MQQHIVRTPGSNLELGHPCKDVMSYCTVCMSGVAPLLHHAIAHACLKPNLRLRAYFMHLKCWLKDDMTPV